jgi:LysM repeat protein
MGNAQMISGVTTWLEVVQRGLGRTPMIYTTASFWNAHLNTEFGDYPLWIAEYGVQSPKIPNGWSNWEFWQHSQTGSVSGVTGSVDMDWFNGSLADLMAMLKVPDIPAMTPTLSPTPTPAQPATTGASTYTVQPGDTLDGIAAQFGVSPSSLAQANDIQNSNLIEVGQVLVIP